ncbi:MAG: phage tail protein [Thermodesulfobacteriota bacterium]|nr:MAG: phage tail protein [Thermodesulfobacteriota bacterium]
MANNYPPAAFYFKAEFGLDGVQNNNSSFQEVTGLNSESDVVEYREGGENSYAHKLPISTKHSNLVLKRGIISDPKIIEWINNVFLNDLSEPIKTTDITVTLLNQEHEPAMRWKLSNAWPIKFEAAPFKAKSNEMVIETIEFAFSTITREKV